MRGKDMEVLKGKIVTLDLISGIRLTTKVESVELESETNRYFVNCTQLIAFVMQVVGQNPQGGLDVKLSQIIPYGVPEMSPGKHNSLALDQIIMAQSSPQGIAENYAKMTSSIITAPAGTALPPMEDIGAAMSKLTGRV